VLSQDPPDDRINRQAICDLARTRIDGLGSRAAFYVLGAGISTAFVPNLWVALCLGLISAAEFAEYRAARALLGDSQSDPGSSNGATTRPRHTRALIVIHIATAIAVALALAAIWAFTAATS